MRLKKADENESDEEPVKGGWLVRMGHRVWEPKLALQVDSVSGNRTVFTPPESTKTQCGKAPKRKKKQSNKFGAPAEISTIAFGVMVVVIKTVSVY